MIGARIKKEVTPTKTHLRKGDRVRVISGKDKNKEGKIIQLSPVNNKVWVENINLIKKHTRPNPKSPKGGVVEKESGFAISNVMILCIQCERPVRIAAKMLTDGKKLRVCRRCGEALEKG